jgi:hypothetical protein
MSHEYNVSIYASLTKWATNTTENHISHYIHRSLCTFLSRFVLNALILLNLQCNFSNCTSTYFSFEQCYKNIKILLYSFFGTKMWCFMPFSGKGDYQHGHLWLTLIYCEQIFKLIYFEIKRIFILLMDVHTWFLVLMTNIISNS